MVWCHHERRVLREAQEFVGIAIQEHLDRAADLDEIAAIEARGLGGSRGNRKGMTAIVTTRAARPISLHPYLELENIGGDGEYLPT